VIGPRRRNRPTAIACAAVLFLIISACASGRDVRSADGVAPGLGSRGSALLGPGTVIGPGVRVEPGSKLVATAFPLQEHHLEIASDRGHDDGWQALLVVDGDPIEVWNRYVEALEISDWASARQACVVRRYAPTGATGGREMSVHDRLLTDPAVDDETQLRCSAQDLHQLVAMTDGVDLRCHGDPAAVSCDRFRARHLYIAWAPPPADAESSTTLRFVAPDAVLFDRRVPPNDPPPVPAGPIEPPRFDRNPAGADRPGAGQRVDAGLDGFLDATEVAVLPSGARSLVEPAMPMNCNSGLTAVVRIPGTPTAVVMGFDDADDRDDPAHLTTRTWRRRPAAHGLIASTGGYSLDVTAVADGAGSSVALLTECGD
jgi:hypothetical protein